MYHYIFEVFVLVSTENVKMSNYVFLCENCQFIKLCTILIIILSSGACLNHINYWYLTITSYLITLLLSTMDVFQCQNNGLPIILV